MLSRARTIFRKLRGRGREPAPSAPPAQTGPPGSPPRAMHRSDVRRSPTAIPRRPSPNQTSISIIVAKAQGVPDSVDLYKLLLREKDCYEDDPTDDLVTDFLCDGWVYDVDFMSPPTDAARFSAYFCLPQHFGLVFTYKASSRESWDETVAAVEGMRRRCTENKVFPFLGTVIIAMGEESEEPAVSHAEAAAFGAQQDALFIKVSPRTGRGICDGVAWLVERANGARDQYADNKEGKDQRYKRAQAFQVLFPKKA
ncbi:hypothetical protein BJX65DRAFT_270783 [Aspergillus insuetus]